MGAQPSGKLDDHRISPGDDEQLDGQISIEDLLREEVMPCDGIVGTDPCIHSRRLPE